MYSVFILWYTVSASEFIKAEKRYRLHIWTPSKSLVFYSPPLEIPPLEIDNLWSLDHMFCFRWQIIITSIMYLIVMMIRNGEYGGDDDNWCYFPWLWLKLKTLLKNDNTYASRLLESIYDTSTFIGVHLYQTYLFILIYLTGRIQETSVF